MSRSALRVFALSVAPFALLACGGGRDASELQLAALRAEISKLRAETAALGERLDAALLSQGIFPGSSAGAKEKAAAGAPSGAPAGGAAKGGDRPDLTVVRLAPDVAPPAPPAGEDLDGDEGPRPVIRSVGGGAVVEDSSSTAPDAADASGRGGDAARKKKKGWSPGGDTSSAKKVETVRPKGPPNEGAGSSKMPVP